MKKLMALAMGVVLTCSAAFAQVNVNETVNGNVINGQVTNVNPGQNLTIGSMITFVSGGQTFQFMVVTTPSANPPGIISDIANAIGNAFNTASVSGQTTAIGGGRNRFGSNAGEFSVQFVQAPIPFDFGITAVLGAGAIAAVKKARNRRKEEEA